MKCYFALSDDVSDNEIYYSMFLCTLESAKKNTTLELNCLYDFRGKFCTNIENDKVYKLLKKYDVKIHLLSIDFEDELFSVYNEEYLKDINVSKSSMYSRFLRFMLGDVEKTDNYVLYADTDLIFLKDIKLESFKNLPETVGVCPEFENTYHYTNFNAGVMLVNVSSYRDAKLRLIELLKNKQHAKIECCDQGYLNTIYENKFEKLDNKYNWKPYWGINKDAVIVHLHGMKPRLHEDDAENYYIEFVSKLIHSNKAAKKGWIYYFGLFADYAKDFVNKDNVLNNVKITLSKQKPYRFCFIFRIFRKIGKILGVSK